jgi:hypothetical protein
VKSISSFGGGIPAIIYLSEQKDYVTRFGTGRCATL